LRGKKNKQPHTQQQQASKKVDSGRIQWLINIIIKATNKESGGPDGGWRRNEKGAKNGEEWGKASFTSVFNFNRGAFTNKTKNFGGLGVYFMFSIILVTR